MNALVKVFLAVALVSCLWVAGCATPPEPFEYEKSNELKPGPGIFTGEQGTYTIYGPPPKPVKEDNAGVSGEQDPEEPDAPDAQ